MVLRWREGSQLEEGEPSVLLCTGTSCGLVYGSWLAGGDIEERRQQVTGLEVVQKTEKGTAVHAACVRPDEARGCVQLLLGRRKEEPRRKLLLFVCSCRRSKCSADAQSQDALTAADPVREAEEQWCDRQGSVSELKSRMHMKHEGAVKRQRAIAYAHSQQRRISKCSGRPSSPASSLRNHESYVEGWMATKPWERSRHMDANLGESHRLQNYEDMRSEGSSLSDARFIKMRRNDGTKCRVEAKPPLVLSASSSDFVCNENSPSSSSVTPESATNTLASEARSDSGHSVGGPSYMSLTKSAKARLDGCGGSRRGQFQLQRQRSGGMPCYKRVALSSLDSESNAASDISAASRGLNSMSLKGRSITRSLDKENENWF